MHASIGEDMRTVSRNTELKTHSELVAHAKKCKLRTEAESARAQGVAQRTSFDDLEESKSRLIPEFEELMTCSFQSDTTFDQASLQVKSETGRSVLEQGECAFPACSTPDHKSKSFKRYERRSTISLFT